MSEIIILKHIDNGHFDAESTKPKKHQIRGIDHAIKFFNDLFGSDSKREKVLSGETRALLKRID